MKVVLFLFSFLCHQHAARSFKMDGYLLPVCQRCAGIYLGIGLSFVFLILTKYHKRGFPPKAVLAFNLLGLCMMPISGLHWIDPGPAWRLWTGLVFGNAVVFLLLPGISILRNKTAPTEPHTVLEKMSFEIFLTGFNFIPFWFPIDAGWFYILVVVLFILGMLGTVWSVLELLLFLIYYAKVKKGRSYEHGIPSKSA